MIGIIFFIAILLLFGITMFGGAAGSAGSTPGTGAGTGNAAPVPVPTEMPAAYIAADSAACQVTGMLSVTGTVQSNVGHVISVQITGIGYDSDGAEMGTGSDSVLVPPYGSSPFSLNVIDGCQIGAVGTFEVRITDIRWRQTI